MSKHPDIAKVREYLIESGYPAGGDALLSLAAVEAELDSKATIESALTKAEALPGHKPLSETMHRGPAHPEGRREQLLDRRCLAADNSPAVPVASVPDGWRVTAENGGIRVDASNGDWEWIPKHGAVGEFLSAIIEATTQEGAAP